MKSILFVLLMCAARAFASAAPAAEIHPNCIQGTTLKTKDVTYYIVPLLEKYDHFTCDQMQGTCIYGKPGEEMLHSIGYQDVPLAQARCKNGYGNRDNCLHPCRTLAASMNHHRFGQIVYLKELVGLKCGNRTRDGYEMIHDGFMVIADTGSPTYFNQPGRFDFFWGRCKPEKNGLCAEGVAVISQRTSHTDFCTVWDPRSPQVNKAIKEAFVRRVQAEDRARGDVGAADDIGKR